MGDEFRHITVTAAEDDDEVIVAGSDGGGRREPAEAPSPEVPQDPTRSPGFRPRGGSYHETTLEDIDGPKMPLMQRIVIVAAIVCIIGALLYYFVAMR